MSLFVRGGLVRGRRSDIRIEGGLITDTGAGLRRRAGEELLDATGCRVVVGLHDHHLHLRATAAAAASVRVGPPEVVDAPALERVLRAAASATPEATWIRAVGYHESVAGLPSRRDLDLLVGSHPLRVQHRSGAVWLCNSAALARLGLCEPGDRGGPASSLQSPDGVERDEWGSPTGRLWRADAWLHARLRQLGDATDDGGADRIGAVSAQAAGLGITGLTDATPGRTDDDLAELADLAASGVVVQRLHLMIAPDTSARAIGDAGRRPRVSVGAVKRLLDDTHLPGPDELAEEIRVAHRRGAPVAVHAVTVAQSVVTVAAMQIAGAVAGDRMEHGAVIPASLLQPLAVSGVVVVTQPGLVAARGDQYLVDVDEGDRDDLWRARSLVAAGVRVAAGSDAPHGPLDPWASAAAAVSRRTCSGAVVGGAEAVGRATALRWWSGEATSPGRCRTVEVGQPGDVVLLALEPPSAPGPGAGPAPVGPALEAPTVVATVVAGVVVHRR